MTLMLKKGFCHKDFILNINRDLKEFQIFFCINSQSDYKKIIQCLRRRKERLWS